MWNRQADRSSGDLPARRSATLRFTAGRLGAGAVTCLCLVALGACAIRLDFAPNASTPTPTGPGISIHVNIVHGQDDSTLVLVPVTIDNRGPYTFAVDTGASTSLIDQPLAQRLGLKQTGGPAPIAGIGSNEQAIPVQISNWHAEQIVLPSRVIASAGLFQSERAVSLQGLLGSDIWNQFGKITIDYNAGTLTVYRQIAADTQRAIPVIMTSTVTARLREL